MTLPFVVGELAATVLTLVACHLVEAFRSIDRRVARTATFNLAYASAMVGWTFVLQPAADAGYRAIAHLGGPWVPLPEHGYAVAFSGLVLMFVEDFLFYWGHRAQHRFAALWAMHSFHHSDDDVNAGTFYRHYWIEKPLWFALTSLPLAFVFRISTEAAVVYAALFQFFGLFPHLNSRIEFGRWSTAILSPQVHRIHHSIQPEHFNTNYCGAFPLWDLVFRTYRAPVRGEFPPTGLSDRAARPSLRDVVLWPLAHPSHESQRAPQPPLTVET